MTARRQLYALRPDGFSWLAARLPKRARQAGLSVTVREEPLFGPGIDAAASLDALAERQAAGGSLLLEPWSAFDGHEIAALTFGPGALRRARRAAARVTEGKGRAKFLFEVEEADGFDPSWSRLAGWQLDPENDQHRSLLADRVGGIESGGIDGDGQITVYLVESWMLAEDALAAPTGEADAGEAKAEPAQTDDFEVLSQPATDLSLVRPLAARAHEHLWRHAPASRGIVGFETPDDLAIPHFASRFGDGADLEIVFFTAPSDAARFTLGRSAATPDLALLYRPDARPGTLDLAEDDRWVLAG